MNVKTPLLCWKRQGMPGHFWRKEQLVQKRNEKLHWLSITFLTQKQSEKEPFLTNGTKCANYRAGRSEYYIAGEHQHKSQCIPIEGLRGNSTCLQASKKTTHPFIVYLYFCVLRHHAFFSKIKASNNILSSIDQYFLAKTLRYWMEARADLQYIQSSTEQGNSIS